MSNGCLALNKHSTKAQHRLQKHKRALENAEAELNRLRIHLAQLQAENQANLQPIKAVFRVDSGYASRGKYRLAD